MNLLDLVAVVLVIVAIVVGFRSGALPQLAGLLGAIAGGVLAIAALPWVEPALQNVEPPVRAFLVLAGILFSVGLGEAVGSAIGRTVAALLGEGVFGTLDRGLGAVVGALQALLVAWLAGGLLAAGPSQTLASQAQTSLLVRALDDMLPAPTELAGQLARLLDDSLLPEFFVGLEPLPAPPVELPDDPLVRDLAELAVPSVVKVTASTCQAVSTGTGFVVERGYVVTNAHVVAGGTTIRVAIGGELLDGVPVLVDPALDVAVLLVAGLEAPPLDLASRDPERGSAGATFGFPGGGALEAEPAAVAGSYDARGRDIYGESAVTRSILELRARVEPGDSGGPLVLADGTVGGLVFAEARTDDDVGYAITASDVRAAIAPAVGRGVAVPTGRCIH